MTVSPNTQAVLLLTAHFSKSNGDAAKPLTPKEWGRFAVWLKDHALTPEQLMTIRPANLLTGWSDRHVTLARIEALMNRGSALALAMDKWLRAGLWVITRSESDYPSRFKRQLGTDSPAVLFGCGNRSLLSGGGLAVIGSRDASDDDLRYTRSLGAGAASQGHTVVSGGARGVDEAAMLGALDGEGTVVGVLADRLLGACSSSKYRRHLVANNLLLISPFHPEAGFNAGNAMQRNKYIYCLSDAALVVHSGTKGGTWNGATENLKRRWVPLWVKRTEDTAAGNAALVDQGAHWAPSNADDVSVSDLFGVGEPAKPATNGLFSTETGAVNDSKDASTANVVTVTPEVRESTTSAPTASSNYEPEQLTTSIDDITFYDFFIDKLRSVCSEAPKTPDELSKAFDVNKTQINTWLKCAIAEEKVKKLAKPVRYEWVGTPQASLFDS